MEKGLEGPGKVPRIVQVMYFKGVPRQSNQQPEPALPQQWEAQWQEFLNTLQPANTGWGNLQLTDMAPWDDTRAFLMAFEQVAEACQWPREEWVRQLLPALRVGMEQSFLRLDARDRNDYAKVKAAILRADAFRMEMKRQHFRQCCYQELEGPRRVYSQLQDLCRQWLKPESHTKEQILEMIIQEQLLGMLPAEAQNWVRECGPKDCVEMVALAEEFLMGHRHAPRTCDWQAPLPEVSVSSLDPEGRQHYNPGASEMTPTRNSVLAHPSSAGLEMAETGTTEEPVRVKEELGLDQKPLHWEVMHRSGSSSSALEGLLVPTPEVDSQTDQPQATFQERPEHGDQIPDALFGASESNQGQSNSTQEQKSPLELLGELSTVSLIAVSDANPVSRLRPRKSRGVERSQISGLKTLKVMLKKLPSPQKGKSKGPDDCHRRTTQLSKTIKRRTICTGERSYNYSDCGKAFSRPSHLYRHEKDIACRKTRPISDSIFAEEKITCRGEEELRSTCPLQQNIKLEDEADDQFSPTVYQEEGQTANEASEPQNRKMHACTKCGYQAEKLADILKHFRVHNKEKPYRYLDCGNALGWSSTLMKHPQTHVGDQQTPVPNVVVAECDVTLSDDEELINFLAKKPPRQEAGLQNCPKRSSKRSPAAVSSKLKVSLPFRSRTERTTAQFRSREKNGKGKAVPCKNNMKKTRYDGLEKKHVCLDCGHRTYFLSDLVRHKNVHPNGKPYKCPDCEKIFVQPSFLKVHLKTHKPGRKPMKRLKAPQGEKKYTCSKCGHKTYKLSTHLLHMRAHVGESEKSYLCDECGKEFKRSSNLSRHKRIHSLNKEGFKIRRPSFTRDKEINRNYEEPKKTTQVHLKKIGGRSAASTASNIAALRKHWRNYKRQQRKKAAEKQQKIEESVKENIEEKETEEKFAPELSLRARLEKFAYSKNRGKEDSQEKRAPDPKVSAEELHQECTVCGKNFTYDGQLTDHQNLDTEAKPHRCNECRK